MIAALATTAPEGELRLETFCGGDWPTGQVVRFPSGPEGTTVKFSEYAMAVAGTPQQIERTGNARVPPADNDG